MIKNSIISCSVGEDIIDVVVGARGPEADKNLLSQQHYALPISTETLAKTGIVAKEVPEEINQCDADR